MMVHRHARQAQDVACEVHDSMGVSNGTTGLGIAVALGRRKHQSPDEMVQQWIAQSGSNP